MCIYNPIVGFYIHLPWRAHSVGSKFALSRAPGNARILLADYACTVVAMDEEEEPVTREWQVLFARVAARRVTSCGCEHPGASAAACIFPCWAAVRELLTTERC